MNEADATIGIANAIGAAGQLLHQTILGASTQLSQALMVSFAILSVAIVIHAILTRRRA